LEAIMAEDKTHVAVIGAGPGGYAAAFMAADLGLEVTLIDPEENPGGVCLYRGCIPSKALLHAAEIIHQARAAETFGVTFADLKVDHHKLRDWKNQVVAKLTGGLGQLVSRRKIRHLRATAVFEAPTVLRVKNLEGHEQRLNFEHAIIATGSKPVAIAGFDTREKGLIDSSGALELDEIPKRLLIVGGGYIGLELGTVYANLGSQVTVAEMTPGLLPGVDGDLTRFLQKALEKRFEAIWLQTKVQGVSRGDSGLRVEVHSEGGESRQADFDRILVAVGRQPYTEGLGLENTRIQRDERGFIKVDRERRTAEAHIFAIGDVAGEPMLAHKASHEGRVAAEVIAGRKVAYEPAGVPAVVFTHPEIAWAGLTEAEAKAQKREYEIARFPWGAASRAATLGEGEGLTKLVIDIPSKRLLGIGIVGAGAGELIAEGMLAIEMGANVDDIGLTIHPHPTLSETLMEAAHLFHGTATHYYRPRKKRA
jgi:dihydrolipoamide dehydrogenase